MADDEDKSFVEESDEDLYDSSKDSNKKRPNAYTIMESDTDSDLSGDDDVYVRAVTPNTSIYKAIRRSIANITHGDQTPNESGSELDDEDFENGVKLTDVNYDSDVDGIRVSRLKKNRIMSDSSSDDVNSEEDPSPVKNRRSKSSRVQTFSVPSDSEDEEEEKQSKNAYRKKKFNAVLNESSDDIEMMSKSISNLSMMSVDADKSVQKTNKQKLTKKMTKIKSSEASKVIDVSENMNETLLDDSDEEPQPLKASSIQKKKRSFVDDSGMSQTNKKPSPDRSLTSDSILIDDSSSDEDNNKEPKKNSIAIDSDSSDDDLQPVNKKNPLRGSIAIDSDSSDARPQSASIISDDETPRASFLSAANNGVPAQKSNSRLIQIEDEIKKSKQFLESGLVDTLPDKGEKIRQNIAQLKADLLKLKNEQNDVKVTKLLDRIDRKKSNVLSTSSPVGNYDYKTNIMDNKKNIFTQPESKSKFNNRLSSPFGNYDNKTNIMNNKNGFDSKKNILKQPEKTNKYNYNIDSDNSSTGGSSSNDSDDDDDARAAEDFLQKSLKDEFDYDKLGALAQEKLEIEAGLTEETLKKIHKSMASCPDESVLHKDPRGLKIKLMPHQQHALAWMLWREKQKNPGGVLADDMGLGKTLTMISLVMASNDLDGDGNKSSDDEDDDWVGSARKMKFNGNTLVVCPASLINQWYKEIKDRTKTGLLAVDVNHGPKRETSASKLAKKDIVITTYAILSGANRVKGTLFNIKWKRVILDEAHVVRNHKSQCSEAVCDLIAEKRWAMTGTPIHNKELDLFALLKFLRVEPFDDIRFWKRWVDNKKSSGHERLAAIMKGLMLRRTKQELMAKGALEALPEKKIDIIWVEMDPEEKVIYQKVMLYSKTLFAQFLTQRAEKQEFYTHEGTYNGFKPFSYSAGDLQFNKAQRALLASHSRVKSHEILVLLLRLRQICCHLSLIHAMLDQEDLEQSGIGDSLGVDEDILKKMNKMKLDRSLLGGGDDDDGEAGVDDRVKNNLLTSDNPVFNRERQSSKLRGVLDLVGEILEKDEKVIVVSQWSTVLDIVAENLDHIKGATYKKFTGKVAVKDRQDVVNAFNHDPNPRILLLSLTAGGVGLNLVGGNNLILMDIHWNPQLESQAQDRIYRFGQRKNVTIYKVLMTDSIEERIKALQESKLEMAASVLTGTGKVINSKLTLDDLKSLFGFK